MQLAALLALPAFCHAATKGVTKLLHSALAAVTKLAAPEAASPAVKLAAAKALRQLCQPASSPQQLLDKACQAMELHAAQPGLVTWNASKLVKEGMCFQAAPRCKLLYRRDSCCWHI